jgi:hypothetical protein
MVLKNNNGGMKLLRTEEDEHLTWKIMPRSCELMIARLKDLA